MDMDANQFAKINTYHRCQACGHRKGEHGGDNNPFRPFACPADGPFPKWSNRVERLKGKEAAVARYDRAVARFWTRRTTFFVPVR